MHATLDRKPSKRSNCCANRMPSCETGCLLIRVAEADILAAVRPPTPRRRLAQSCNLLEGKEGRKKSRAMPASERRRLIKGDED